VGDEAATALGDVGLPPAVHAAGAPPAAPEFRKMVRIHYWMAALQGTRKLVELCLPGSHDAGVYTDEKRDVTPGDTARCQYKNIGEQASEGSRVFDIRCFLRTTGPLWDRKKIPTMGHFFADTAPLGDYGGTLESALEDAANFLTINNSEFLIFRIGHTECLEEVAEVLEKFRNITNKTTGKTNATLFHRGAKGSLADVEVRHLRGKLVVLCDNEGLQSDNFKPSDGYYYYDKYSSTSSSAQVRFCGTYTGDLKTASKPLKKDKGNWSPEGAVKNAEEASQRHKNHSPDHLFWIYWQETGGNVFKNTTDKLGMHNRLKNFLSRIKDSKNNLALPNVIGHDFVDRFTCGEIAKMNMDVSTELEPYSY
jgi:hypothetical protein